ncbi:MAG: hypothetical protein ACYDDS_12130 [Candidatus Sulfotelmatobacter sp.]
MAVTAAGTLKVVIANAEFVIVTTVLAWTVLWAVLLAVTVIDFAPPLVGAVNKPLDVMVPAEADQLTAVLLVLLTAAANWSFALAAISGSAGEICTVTEFPRTAIV